MSEDIKKEEQLNSELTEQASLDESINEPEEKQYESEDIKSQEQKPKEKFFDKKFVIFSCVLLVVIAVSVFVNSVLTFMVVVSGSSMKPTFQGGEVLFVNRTVEPERGDIIIVKVMEKTVTSGGGSTIQEVWIIKRLIALPGDKVEIKEGYVYVNDQQLEESYLSKQGITEEIDWQTRTLGENEYFYLGDNRGVGQSSDSRDESKGACPREDILGVVTESAIKSMGFSKFVYNFTSPLRNLIYNIRGN